MELTRRDAVAALASLGTGAGALGLSRHHQESGSGTAEGPDDETVQQVMTAVAQVVYPEEVEGVDEFVSTFLSGRLADEDRRAGIRAAVATLDEQARRFYDQSVTALGAEQRDQLLRELGVDAAAEDPDGTTSERLRFYVVNELLLALYSSPTGGELVGIENPQGHPGGVDSYQRGPR